MVISSGQSPKSPVIRPFDQLGVLGFFVISAAVFLLMLLFCFFYAGGGGGGGGGSWGLGMVRVEDGDGDCDLLQGEWVWDEGYPLYDSRDCPFLDEGFRCSENGRPDRLYTKWRWQPTHCNLPRFDARAMLERLQNRRLVFVGDSIGRNQWESLLCMLSSAVRDKGLVYEVNGSPITKHTGFLVFMFRDYNCTVEYYRSTFLVVQSRAPAGSPERVKTTLKLDVIDWMSSRWRDADVLIFNTGHWWNYEKTIRGGGDWRTGGSCHQETLPELGPAPLLQKAWAQFLNPFRNITLQRHFHNPGIDMDVLNVTHMTAQRRDGHLSLYYLGPSEPAPIHRQDCSHWCLPGVPDIWNELLYAFFLRWQRRQSSSARNSTDVS